jgi:hypothetical protein
MDETAKRMFTLKSLAKGGIRVNESGLFLEKSVTAAG